MTAAGKAELCVAYNPSEKLILWVKFISAFWRQKQLFSVHTIGQILFAQILEVTFGKTQFSFIDDIFHPFLEGGGVCV